IFTSGSTGSPKGVMISHRAAMNTIFDVNRRFNIDTADRIFALSPLSFDLSVYDIFGTLAAGATCVIPGADAFLDPGHWCDEIEREHVTIWNSVPSLLSLLLEYVDGRRENALVSLRVAMLSGDWISLSLPPRFKAILPKARLTSLGGATEVSIWSI